MASRSQDKKQEATTYRDAGVDIDAGNALVEAIGPLAARTHRKGVIGAIGGFGGLFDPRAAGYDDPVLVSATDGVGTKLKIAIETGMHDNIGIDLVAMCVNDLIVQGAEPLFFLDYFACGKLEPKVAEAVIGGIAVGCESAGAALIGGETAEMPGMYPPGHYDLAGFAVGAVSRGDILPRDDMEEGDCLIALPSSGIHSNGFSLVRHVAHASGVDWSDSAPFDHAGSLGEALLTPTRIYVRPLLEAIRRTGAIKGIAHITGGGLTENLPRVLPPSLSAMVELDTIPPQPVFSWLAQAGHIADLEMLRTFNCGVGMAVVAPAPQAEDVLKVLRKAGENAFLLGVIESRKEDAPVRFRGKLAALS